MKRYDKNKRFKKFLPADSCRQFYVYFQRLTVVLRESSEGYYARSMERRNAFSLSLRGFSKISSGAPSSTTIP